MRRGPSFEGGSTRHDSDPLVYIPVLRGPRKRGNAIRVFKLRFEGFMCVNQGLGCRDQGLGFRG